MKRIHRLIFTLLFTLTATISVAQYKQRTFIIGSFADPNLSKPENWEKDMATFGRAKAAYFNLLTGPQFYTGARDFSMLDRLIKIADAVDMQLLAIDSRLGITRDTFAQRHADMIISHFKSKKSKSLIGYNFGGEFPHEETPRVTKWVGYFKSKDPGKLAYTYLLPRYGFQSNKAYETYLDGYLKNSNTRHIPDVVAYDHYPFNGPNNKMRGDYFYNLDIIARKAGSRPFWIYILTTKHLVYPEPDRYQLYYTTSSPLAYGAKGLLYFTYETLPYKEYSTGLIDKSGKPTFKFDIVKNINHYIHDIVGPVIMSSKRLATYHTSTSSEYEQFPSQALPRNNKFLLSANNDDLLIGVFQHATKKTNYYLYVVNKSPRPATQVQLRIGKKLGSKYRISPHITGYSGEIKSTILASNPAGQTINVVQFDLEPGEGRLISITN